MSTWAYEYFHVRRYSTQAYHSCTVARNTAQKMSELTLNHDVVLQPQDLPQEKLVAGDGEDDLLCTLVGIHSNGGDSEHGNAIRRAVPWDIHSDTPHDNP